VIPIVAPTDEERAHHYLWRFWRHLSRAGKLTIFDRSWYGRVLVERVECFATLEEYQRAYAEINHSERQLVDRGIVLVKFWLHITKDEQLRRFRERQQTAHKRWKITDEDWRNRRKWNDSSRSQRWWHAPVRDARRGCWWRPTTSTSLGSRSYGRWLTVSSACSSADPGVDWPAIEDGSKGLLQQAWPLSENIEQLVPLNLEDRSGVRHNQPEFPNLTAGIDTGKRLVHTNRVTGCTMSYAVMTAKAYGNISTTVLRSAGRISTTLERRVRRPVVRLVVDISEERAGLGKRRAYEMVPTASAAGESSRMAVGVATYFEWAS
jgi:hypothetical protein